jgi:plasmid stabilization system protein ParE
MSLPLIVRPEAEDDLRQVHAHLQDSRPGLAERFRSELRGLFERIESRPELYGRAWQDVRAALLKKLPYVVYYVVFADRIEILAVLHGSRDRAVWQSRL